jgi:hypothetical protein
VHRRVHRRASCDGGILSQYQRSLFRVLAYAISLGSKDIAFSFL